MTENPNTILSLDHIELLKDMSLKIDILLNYSTYHNQPIIPALKQLISLRNKMTTFLDGSLDQIMTWEE